MRVSDDLSRINVNLVLTKGFILVADLFFTPVDVRVRGADHAHVLPWNICARSLIHPFLATAGENHFFLFSSCFQIATITTVNLLNPRVDSSLK